ncbi:Umecyanin-like protein [Drosera capensis]
MARNRTMFGINAVLVMACLPALRLCSAQTVHVVGGSSGWINPSSSSVYSTWADTQTFNVGDILEFNFATNSHTVATVSQSDYTSCSTASPISIKTTGPANITVAAGTTYFICTFTGHCGAGQKLAVTASSSTPPPPAAASSPPPPSSAGSGATPAAAAGVFGSLVAVLMAFVVLG